MNIHTKALKIATEANAPHNVDMIERQLVAKRDHYAELTATARQIEQDREVARARFYAAKAKRSETLLLEAKAKTAGLTDEQKVRLAIFVLDGVNGISTDLRIEAESVLADILSGVRT